MRNKHNIVLYLDKELVEKSKALGFNLSRTFENHLKHLITQLTTTQNTQNHHHAASNAEMVGRTGFEPVTFCTSSTWNTSEVASKFREFLKVDLRRSEKTAYEHTYYVKRFLNELNVQLELVTSDNIREYLKSLNVSSAQYKNILMALKLFFRDFLKKPDVVASFKFPHQVFKPKHIVGTEQVRRFYQALESVKEKALFMLYATSGLRREEIMSLRPEDVDFEKRMITPSNHLGETKKSWVSFYNEEAEVALNEYLVSKTNSRSKKLFPLGRNDRGGRLWKSAKKKTGINITPQKLRQWFCSEMLRLGVSETYVDAFCGRVPKSVLARHYTDFSPEKLRGIYEKAVLSVAN